MELDAAEDRVAPPTETRTNMAGTRFYGGRVVEDMAGTGLRGNNLSKRIVLKLSLSERQLEVVDVLVAAELYHLGNVRKRAADAGFPDVGRYSFEVVYHPQRIVETGERRQLSLKTAPLAGDFVETGIARARSALQLVQAIRKLLARSVLETYNEKTRREEAQHGGNDVTPKDRNAKRTTYPRTAGGKYYRDVLLAKPSYALTYACGSGHAVFPLEAKFYIFCDVCQAKKRPKQKKVGFSRLL
jgi:hypothetical protein